MALSVQTARAEPTESYSTTVILCDAGAALTVAGGLFYLEVRYATGSSASRTPGYAAMGVGMVAYSATAPLVHLGKANSRGAIRSALVRVALPVVAGAAMAGSSASAGVALGVAGAMFLDWTVFSRVHSTHVFVTPAATGAQLGVTGTF